jgi:hypothetical protein
VRPGLCPCQARLLKQALSGTTITAEQAVAFIHCQHDFDGKNQAAILSYASLDDKGAMDQVLAALKFPEDRAEVKKALGLA